MKSVGSSVWNWVILLGAAIAAGWAILNSPVYGFASVTCITAILVGSRAYMKRLRFERILFFRKPYGIIGSILLGGAFVCLLSFAALAAYVTALFTIPSPGDLVKDIENADLLALSKAMQDDALWTGIVAGTVLILAIPILLLCERWLGIKAARWGFFRLPLIIGLVFSIGITIVGDVSKREAPNGLFSQPIFPQPTFAQSMPLIRGIFGGAALDNDFRARQRQLDDVVEDMKIETQSQLSALSMIQSMTSNNFELCFVASENFKSNQLCKKEIEKRDFWNNGNRLRKNPQCWRPFSQEDGNKHIQNLWKLIETTDDSKTRLWHLLQCGRVSEKQSSEPNTWCTEQNGKGIRQPGCFDWIAEARANPENTEDRASLIADILTMEEENTVKLENVNSANAPALLTVLDGFTQDRIVEFIDWSVLELLHVPKPPIAVATDQPDEPKVDGSEYIEGLDPEWLVRNVCDNERLQSNWWCGADQSWFGASLRFVARAFFSPQVAQGFVLSTYLCAFLLVFGRDGHGRLKLEEVPKELWDYAEKDPADKPFAKET